MKSLIMSLGVMVWGWMPGVAVADGVMGGALGGMPEGTRWVMHVDVDAARMTPLWGMAQKKLYEPRPGLKQAVGMVERITRMKMPEDLHDVTMFGSAYEDGVVCIRIHGVIDKDAVIAFMRGDPEFKLQDHNGHDVITWRDKNRDRLMYAGFGKGAGGGAGADVTVLSPGLQVVEGSLDVMDGKAEGLKVDSPLLPAREAAAAGTATGASKEPMLWLAGSGLADLPRGGAGGGAGTGAESPVLSAMEAASIGMRWGNEKLVTEWKVTTKTEKEAQQMQAVAEGVKALVALSASDEHASAGVKILSGEMQKLTVTTEGKVVRGEWSVDKDELERIDTMINLAMEDGGGAPVPAVLGASVKH